jgi:hypothetical protein
MTDETIYEDDSHGLHMLVDALIDQHFIEPNDYTHIYKNAERVLRRHGIRIGEDRKKVDHIISEYLDEIKSYRRKPKMINIALEYEELSQLERMLRNVYTPPRPRTPGACAMDKVLTALREAHKHTLLISKKEAYTEDDTKYLWVDLVWNGDVYTVLYTKSENKFWEWTNGDNELFADYARYYWHEYADDILDAMFFGPKKEELLYIR